MAGFRTLTGFLKAGALFLLLAACLFGGSRTLASSGVLGSLVREIEAVCRDPGTQWMVFVCAGVYFATFAWLLCRRSGERFFVWGNSILWLAFALFFASFGYAADYPTASQSLQPLVLVTGAALGLGFAVWVSWPDRKGGAGNLPAPPGDAPSGMRTALDKRQHGGSEAVALSVPSGGSPAGTGKSPVLPSARPQARCLFQLEGTVRKVGFLLWALVALLAVAAFWRTDGPMTFRYRGEARWSGPWDNPNEYGVLMAVGVVLAAGLLVAGCKLQVAGWRAVAWRWLTMLSIVVGAVATGAGLFKSYSRGAWLGAVCGLGFLAWRWVNHGIRERHALQSAIRNPQSAIARCGSCVLWFRRNGLAFALVLVSLFVVAFWSLRQTEFAPVRRLFSAGNVNDFSWRNRVDAWEGAVQIMAGKPWLGWGWTRPEQIYDHYYRAARLEEGMAIQLNDFFTLGMALGMPALGCFAVFVWLSVLRSAECGVRNLSDSAISGFGFRISDFLPAVCRAGAIVLLLGFWFDGGLFKLHLATPFWILLSLGAVRRPQVES